MFLIVPNTFIPDSKRIEKDFIDCLSALKTYKVKRIL